MELLAELPEALYGIVAFHSDVLCKARRELDTISFCSGLMRKERDDVFFKIRHPSAIVHATQSP
jgi:hypothetical protein